MFPIPIRTLLVLDVSTTTTTTTSNVNVDSANADQTEPDIITPTRSSFSISGQQYVRTRAGNLVRRKSSGVGLNRKCVRLVFAAWVVGWGRLDWMCRTRTNELGGKGCEADTMCTGWTSTRTRKRRNLVGISRKRVSLGMSDAGFGLSGGYSLGPFECSFGHGDIKRNGNHPGAQGRPLFFFFSSFCSLTPRQPRRRLRNTFKRCLSTSFDLSLRTRPSEDLGL
jgi:hypothetical protein